MEFLEFLAPRSLSLDDAAIAVAGPWAAVAHFVLSVSSRGEPWRLGDASSGEFWWSANREGVPGACTSLFKGRCPMGLDLEALRRISADRPALAFACATEGRQDGLTLQWVQTGAFMEGGSDEMMHIADRYASFERGWAAEDLALRSGLLDDDLAGIDPSWAGTLSSRGRSLAANPEFIRLLAGAATDRGFWSRWPRDEFGLIWRWPPAPWVPEPFWGRTPSAGAELLGSMAGHSELRVGSRQAAASRALAIAAALEPREPERADRWLGASLAKARDAQARSSWCLAAGEACLTECIGLARALPLAGLSLCDLFSVPAFLGLASQRSDKARALLNSCPPRAWGYGKAELMRLCFTPPEVACLVEARLLDETGDGRLRGSSRL